MVLLIATGSEKQDRELKEVTQKAGYVIAECQDYKKALWNKVDRFDAVILGHKALTIANKRALYNLCDQNKRAILLVTENTGPL